MFYLLQKDLRFQVFILIVLTGVFCFQLFTPPVAFSMYDPALPYALTLDEWVSGHPTGACIGILFLYVIQQMLLLTFFKKNRFVEQESFLPCIAMAAFLVVCNMASFCTPVFIANTAIVGILVLSDDSESHNQKTRALLAGILISITTLYDPTLILLTLTVFIILLTNRFNTKRDIFVTLIGIVIPYIYVLSYHFFVGNLPEYLTSFTRFSFHFPLFTATRPSIVAIICIAVCTIFLIYILVKLNVHYSHKLIVVRKRFVNMHFLFATLVCVMFLTNLPYPNSLGYLFVPISIYLAAYAPSRHFSIAKEVVLTILLTAITLIGIGL